MTLAPQGTDVKKLFFPGLILVFILSFKPPFATPEPSYQIAIIKSRSMDPYEQAAQGIQQEFKAEGIGARFEFYNIEGDIEKGAEISKKIQESNSDLVFTIGTEAFKAVSGHLNQIPMVTAMLVDPLGEDVITKDQDNVYGAYLKVPFEKQFSVIKKIIPQLNPIAMICWCQPGKKRVAVEAQPQAEQAGISLIAVKIDSVKSLGTSLEEALRQSKALLIAFDNDLYNSATSKELLLFSARNKFPIIAFSPNYVKAGALFSLSSNFSENGKSAAMLAVSVLRKEPIKEPFVPTSKVWVAWNKNVAEAFGIKLSSEGEKEINEYV